MHRPALNLGYQQVSIHLNGSLGDGKLFRRDPTTVELVQLGICPPFGLEASQRSAYPREGS